MIRTPDPAFAIASVAPRAAGENASVAVLADGRFVVVWQETLGRPADGFADTDGAVFARIYGDRGLPVSETLLVNSWAPGDQGDATVVADATGGFQVLWHSRMNWGGRLPDHDAFQRGFDAEGRPVGFANELDGDNPGGAEDPGSFLVALNDGRFAQVFKSTTVTVFSDPAADPLATVSLGQAASGSGYLVADLCQLGSGNVVMLGAIEGVARGPVVVRISDETLTEAPKGVGGQVAPVFFSLFEGAVATAARIVALDPGTLGNMTHRPGFAAAALQPDGMAGSRLVVETFTPWGQRIGSATVDIPLSLNDMVPEYDLLALKNGSFLLAWTTTDADGLGIRLQHFDADGSPLGRAIWAPTGQDGDQTDPTLTLLPDGRVLLVYTTGSQDPLNGAVETLHAVRLDVTSDASTRPPTDAADVLTLTGADDALEALGGDDVIYAGGGQDLLRGGTGNDRLYGEAGDDALQGDDGADDLFGGAGKDGLSGGNGRDRLTGGAGRDALLGGAGADTLLGGGGDDRLAGGGGNDRLTGGAGVDAFVFAQGGGQDRITDFAAEDVLRLDRTLWSAHADLTAGQVLNRFATVDGADLVFSFAGGEVLRIEGGAWLTATDLQLI